MMSSWKEAIPKWFEPAFIGVIGGCIGTAVILAFGFGWVSGGTVVSRSAEQAQTAVVAYAIPACVARFQRQPNFDAALKNLAASDHQSEMIVSGGWTAERGQKIDAQVSSIIAQGCADTILASKTSPDAKLSAVH